GFGLLNVADRGEVRRDWRLGFDRDDLAVLLPGCLEQLCELRPAPSAVSATICKFSSKRQQMSDGIDEDERLSRLGEWLAGRRSRIEGQVHTKFHRHSPRQSQVSIEHRLPCPLDDHVGWRISTRETLLPREHFSSYAAAHLKGAANRNRAF